MTPKIQLVNPQFRWLSNTGFKNPYLKLPIYENQKTHRPVCGLSYLGKDKRRLSIRKQYYKNGQRIFTPEMGFTNANVVNYEGFQYLQFKIHGIPVLMTGNKQEFDSLTVRKDGDYPNYWGSLEKGKVTIHKRLSDTEKDNFRELLETVQVLETCQELNGMSIKTLIPDSVEYEVYGFFPEKLRTL